MAVAPALHPQATHPSTPSRALELADAPEVERGALDRLLRGESWPRRAVAALRLERYGCGESQARLTQLLDDESWQVRSYALRTLARRGVEPPEGWLARQREPRLVRTALRYRCTMDGERLGRGVKALARSNDLKDKMLAAELGAISGDDELRELARTTARQVILRMGRAEAGAFSPRLALLTGQRDMRRHYEWQQWLMKRGRRFELQPAHAIGEDRRPVGSSKLAQLDAETFANLEEYMAKLSERELDLAIALDCTASMWGELAAAQGGIDDMVMFISDIVGSFRFGLVAYRDQKDDFETKMLDFTAEVEAVRSALWQLTAEGGGDHPESVYEALKVVFANLTWRADSTKVLAIVGDAPPHVGTGALCESIIQRAHGQAQVVTHAIQAENKAVKHFAEMAKAGGGRCVSLADDDTLIAEITGLTLGDRFEDEFREFFHIYLDLCR